MYFFCPPCVQGVPLTSPHNTGRGRPQPVVLGLSLVDFPAVYSWSESSVSQYQTDSLMQNKKKSL